MALKHIVVLLVLVKVFQKVQAQMMHPEITCSLMQTVEIHIGLSQITILASYLSESCTKIRVLVVKN